MKSIKSLLTEDPIDKPGLVRYKYLPYSNSITKNVWLGFVKEYVNSDNFKIEQQQAEVWSELIKYIHGDNECVYDLNKSICLIGKTGSSKTITMHIMNQYMAIDNVKYYRDGRVLPFKFRIVTSREIVSEYQSNGYDGISKYMVIGNLCIDDLGTEPETTVHYGAKLDAIVEVIETRYSKGLFMHFTSNLNEEMIKERYNDRVYSRIKHQCNIIVLSDKDFRIN